MNQAIRREYPVQGAGLGFRRDLIDELTQSFPEQVSFMEVAPENWMRVGGKAGKVFRSFTEAHDFVCHGLSLSIGSPAPLDEDFVREVRDFLDLHGIQVYSEHLSYCSDDGHLYDLMPIPFTEEAVHYVADRIKRVQDILERRIAMENVFYYAAPGQQMTEIEFVNAVIEEADCDFHIDINNIYVNAINHRYDPEEFLKALPGHRIVYAHIAGHFVEAEDLRVDTHGDDVCEPVWDLLKVAYQEFGVFPTLLERDFNIPPLTELIKEVDRILQYQGQSIEPKLAAQAS